MRLGLSLDSRLSTPLARGYRDRMSRKTCIALSLGFLTLLSRPTDVFAAGAGDDATRIAKQLPLWSMAPFLGLLLSIAVLPLVAPRWWHSNWNKGWVAAAYAIPVAIYLIWRFEAAGLAQICEKLHEYTAFLAVIGSLFVICGGIHIESSHRGTPLANTALLAIGAVTASFISTTGAAMLLLRPLLRANAGRNAAHVVVFFIFIVANCGGLLTPLGDPPLFLGFLAGVPFGWTLRLWEPWLLLNGALLVIFFVWDRRIAGSEPSGATQEAGIEPTGRTANLVIHGWHNLFFLAGVVATIYAAGAGWGRRGEPWPLGVAEGLMLMLAVAAYCTTKRKIRLENRFDFVPLIEVAVLFAGIFITMTPALLVLNSHSDRLGLHSPEQFFWASGLLSGFLDNAPTYMTFTSVAAGLHDIPAHGRFLAQFVALPDHTGAQRLLAAISCGSVFLGAATYIGNGPNFMVKSIAEESGVAMPSFFGYLAYSMGVFLPTVAIVQALFFL